MEISMRKICLLYDEDFNRKMKIAKFLVKNLREKKEIELAKKWLVRVSNIKSPVLDVKKNRNAFLSYMVKVLGDGVLTGCTDFEEGATTVCDPDRSLAFLEHPNDLSGLESSDEASQPEEPKKKIKMRYHSRWSNDHRTYVAVKPIPGRGALVYLASSKHPGLDNWDIPDKK